MKFKVFLSLLLIGIALLFCVRYLFQHLRSEFDKREQESDEYSSTVDSPIPRIPRSVEIPADIRQQFASAPIKPALITEIDPSGSLESVKFSPTNPNFLVSMTSYYWSKEEDNIMLWDVRNPSTPLATFHGESFSFSPDGDILAISNSGTDNVIKLWDITDGKYISDVRVYGRDLAFSPNRIHLAVSSLGLKFIDVSNPKMPVEAFKYENNTLDDNLTFSAEGKLLATEDSRNDRVNIWEIYEDHIIKKHHIDVVEGKKFGWIETFKFSPNPQTPILAVATYNRDIRLYYPPDWQNYKVIPAGNIKDFVFTKDGNTLITGGYSEMAFWSVGSGNLQASIDGYSGRVDVSADSRYVAAEGNDDIIRVFEISNFLPSRQSIASNVIVPIYFLPTNRQPQADIPEKIGQMLKDVQSFFADEMERHGYGRKSFEFEKNSDDSAKVYLFEGETTDKYYKGSTNSRFVKEISQHFNAKNNIFFIIVDKSHEVKPNEIRKTPAEIERNITAIIKRSTAKIDRLTFQLQGLVFRQQGGEIVLDKSIDSYSKDAIILKFASTFGLDRDYRDPSYLMSYSDQSKHLSKSSAAWLNKCKYFNSVETYFDHKTVIGKLSRSRRIAEFIVEDADGVSQVRLLVKPSNEKPPTVFQWKSDPAENQSVWKRKFLGYHFVLHDFITLNGEKKATIELDYPTYTDIPFEILVIDELGNRVYKYTKKRRNLLTLFLQRILN